MEPQDDAQAALFEGGRIEAASPTAAAVEAAAALRARWGDRLHLGTSSWGFPGWAGLVWRGHYPQPLLSRGGLAAYATHPLLRTVSVDRTLYRPMAADDYARLAVQVPADFRFVIKAPAEVCDAARRDAQTGAPVASNAAFLDPALAVALCARPAALGLGDRLGVLVFQLAPLPTCWLLDEAALHERLAAVWRAIQPELPAHTIVALELRDASLLTPALARHLREHAVRSCLGLHDRLPVIDDQLPLHRALWPGDLVCRWSLQRGQRYTQARERWAPFDRLQAPDVATRTTLARVVAATLNAGHSAFITINNKAEGSAPHSVMELALALLAQR